MLVGVIGIVATAGSETTDDSSSLAEDHVSLADAAIAHAVRPDGQIVLPKDSSEKSRDDEVSTVIGEDGEAIRCNGKRLLVEDQGAEAPVAYLEGDQGNAVALSSSESLEAGGGYAARCDSEGNVYWKIYQ